MNARGVLGDRRVLGQTDGRVENHDMGRDEGRYTGGEPDRNGLGESRAR